MQTNNLFKHGIELLFPRTEDGPSLYALLEGAWMNVALIQGVRQKVWESAKSGEPNAVAACWANLGLLTPAGLTPAGLRVVECVELLEYEFSMMQQQLSGDFKTDPVKYQGLRVALGNYTKQFMPDMLRWVAEQRLGDDPVQVFMDFCGGDGVYVKHWLRAWPDSYGMLFDRTTPEEMDADIAQQLAAFGGDALGSDQFFETYAGTYDVLLMSEILHCKGFTERALLLERAKKLLRPGGVLLVIEQYPNLRLEWRMQDMTKDGQCLSEIEVTEEAHNAGFLPISGIRSLSHYGIRFEKAI